MDNVLLSPEINQILDTVKNMPLNIETYNIIRYKILAYLNKFIHSHNYYNNDYDIQFTIANNKSKLDVFPDNMFTALLFQGIFVTPKSITDEHYYRVNDTTIMIKEFDNSTWKYRIINKLVEGGTNER